MEPHRPSPAASSFSAPSPPAASPRTAGPDGGCDTAGSSAGTCPHRQGVVSNHKQHDHECPRGYPPIKLCLGFGPVDIVLCWLLRVVLVAFVVAPRIRTVVRPRPLKQRTGLITPPDFS
jgi:hypothetical protein